MDRRAFLGCTSAMSLVSALPVIAPRTVIGKDLPADATSMSASVLCAAIKQRHISCKEVMQAYLARIERYNGTYNAIVSLRDADSLIAEAERADRDLARGQHRGWLHGLPVAVKDLNNVRGMPTSMGSPIFAGQVAEHDNLMVRRMRRDGAIFIGKTNVPEFGMGSQSYNPVFGATGSAYDPKLTAGGSSGGAACGLATHMLPIADGSDMMGSLRNPGAYNNIIGYRPTQGRVPNDFGKDLFYQQLGIGGPMGRNTEDTVRLLGTLAGAAPRLPLAQRDTLPSSAEFQATTLKGLRVGWLGDYDGYLETEPGLLALCESNLRTLSDQGAIVESVRPDYDMDRLWQTWLTLRHWGRNGMRSFYDDPDLRAKLKPEAVWEIEGCFDLTAQQVYEAGIARADWFRAVHRLFEQHDILLLPTAQVFPFDKTIHWPAQINQRPMDTYHRWMEVVIGATLAGLPTVNVPAGFDQMGRPMGMQAMAPFGQDQRALEFSLAYEAVTDHLGRKPTLVAASASS